MNTKQRAFAAHVALDGCDFSQAAILAGYSPKTARSSGSRLAKLPKVAREIERLRKGGSVKPVRKIPASRTELIEAVDVAAAPPLEIESRRAWLLETFVELAAQRENLSIALRAAEWLAVSYRLRESVVVSVEVQDRTIDEIAGGLDLATACAIREAARKAA